MSSRATTAAIVSRSKKRSGASSTLSPPDPLVFFVDRSLGRRTVATALRNAGALVEIHDDHSPPDALDETWLNVVGQREWVALSKVMVPTHPDRPFRPIPIAHSDRS